MNENPKQTILLATGGTGGHMVPAQALAQDLVSRGFHVEIITDIRGAKFGHLYEGVPMHLIRSAALGSGLVAKMRSMIEMSIGLLQARRLMDKLKPVVVVGFGGYPSVPGVLAAQQKKITTIIHEQNAILGRANAFLAPKADRIALSYVHVSGIQNADASRAVITGNPVRPDIAALYTQPYPVLQQDGTLRIFIMGGSLGAKIFSDIVPKALARLAPEQRARLEIAQQCREEDLDRVRRIYDEAAIHARLEPFFRDVPDQLSRAHLIISRSGASTVAEVTTAGRPAIFVPYPHHSDQQQKINADAVADAGGAWVMTEEGFTEDALLTRIENFLQNPQTLFRAAELARIWGRPDAARKLGNLVTTIASGWERRGQVRTTEKED